jgi:hypothetical protein
MKYAHIFKAGKRWQLIISETPSLVESETAGYFDNKSDAKARAAAIGAKPWNY